MHAFPCMAFSFIKELPLEKKQKQKKNKQKQNKQKKPKKKPQAF